MTGISQLKNIGTFTVHCINFKIRNEDLSPVIKVCKAIREICYPVFYIYTDSFFFQRISVCINHSTA